MGCSGSRSNSPADSETSGVSSMDGSLSDIMVIIVETVILLDNKKFCKRLCMQRVDHGFQNCLSMNSGQHPCYPQSFGSLMSSEADLCSGGRAAAYQRMAAKKYMSSPHQHQQSALHHHHSHNHMRNHQYVQNQTRNYLSSLLGSEKNCCPAGNSQHVMSGNSLAPNGPEQQTSLDRAARFHRNAACEY